MARYVEYLVEKKGLGSTTYFIYAKQDGDGWLAGFFPAYMAPDPSEVDDLIFDLANPDHTVTGSTKDEAEDRMREWVESKYSILERRLERKPA